MSVRKHHTKVYIIDGFTLHIDICLFFCFYLTCVVSFCLLFAVILVQWCPIHHFFFGDTVILTWWMGPGPGPPRLQISRKSFLWVLKGEPFLVWYWFLGVKAAKTRWCCSCECRVCLTFITCNFCLFSDQSFVLLHLDDRLLCIHMYRLFSSFMYTSIHIIYYHATPNCQSRGAFVILWPYLWGELFGKSLHLQRLVAEL